MFRRRAVNKYYKKLHFHLRKRYSLSESYTVGQVEKTVQECGFSQKYLPYALALFLKKSEFEELLKSKYLSFNANEIRVYIAKRFFEGNLNYEYTSQLERFVGNSGHTTLGNHSESSALR